MIEHYMNRDMELLSLRKKDDFDKVFASAITLNIALT